LDCVALRAPFAAGVSQIPSIVITAALAGTVLPLSGVCALAPVAEDAGLELGFTGEGEVACPTATEQSSRIARLRMHMRKSPEAISGIL
jgi:hypothetical protein